MSRDFFLAAVFLWYTPLEAALSIAAMACRRSSFVFASFAPAATVTFLTAVFVKDFTCLLRACLFAATLMRFCADLMFAKIVTSSDLRILPNLSGIVKLINCDFQPVFYLQ